LAFPKRFAPLTTDPAAGIEEPPDGAPAAVVVAEDPPVAGVVGLVLEHPAIATAITTSMIAIILIREIFILTPPYAMDIPDNVPNETGIRMSGSVGNLCAILLKNFEKSFSREFFQSK
jgi:hypothetical protein